jgi:hypothetical protein
MNEISYTLIDPAPTNIMFRFQSLIVQVKEMSAILPHEHKGTH